MVGYKHSKVSTERENCTVNTIEKKWFVWPPIKLEWIKTDEQISMTQTLWETHELVTSETWGSFGNE